MKCNNILKLSLILTSEWSRLFENKKKKKKKKKREILWNMSHKNFPFSSIIFQLIHISLFQENWSKLRNK